MNNIANTFLIVMYTFLTYFFCYKLKGYKRLNPIYYFVIFQWIMAVGTLWLVDLDKVSDQLHALGYFLALIFFNLGAMFHFTYFKVGTHYSNFYKKIITNDYYSSRQVLLLILSTSVIAVLIYYYLVGSNIFINIILGIAIDDYSTLRLMAYSGDDYFAPGYFNQFKNVLLPITFSIYATSLYIERKNILLKVVLFLFIPFIIIALLGTGQRAFLLYSFSAFIFGLAGIVNFRKKLIILICIPIYILYLIMTYSYKKNILNDNNQIISTIVSSIERIFLVEQEGSLGAYHYLYTKEINFFEEWGQQIFGFLPGGQKSTIQHDLFEMIHGTSRGTEGFSTVVSILYNGGIFSLPLVYLILGITYSSLFYLFLKGERTIYRTYAYGALFFYISIFVSGGPSTLINNGVITILLLLSLRKIKFSLY